MGTDPEAAADRDAAAAALPSGVLWRRALDALVVRLGLMPGGGVVLVAPATHDPIVFFEARHPRAAWIRFGPPKGPLALPRDREAMDRVTWCTGPVEAPPFAPGSVETVITLFPEVGMAPGIHGAYAEAWGEILPPYARWFELVAAEGPRDPALAVGEEHLKSAGFEKVRTGRLALGRAGSALFLRTARAIGDAFLDDEE